MKKALRTALSALVLTLFLVPVTFAQSASGGFEAKSDLGLTTIKFSATGFSNGSASGDIDFSGPISIPDQDVDGDGGGDPSVKEGTLSMHVDVDCMKVEGNRAVLAGVVRTSSVDAYARRRMILTVEDGDGLKAPDAFTWGQYSGNEPTWVPSDAELEKDPGVGLQWYATDAERKDDVGISSGRRGGFDCQSFTLASYTLDDLSDGSGDIVVKP